MSDENALLCVEICKVLKYNFMLGIVLQVEFEELPILLIDL